MATAEAYYRRLKRQQQGSERRRQEQRFRDPQARLQRLKGAAQAAGAPAPSPARQQGRPSAGALDGGSLEGRASSSRKGQVGAQEEEGGGSRRSTWPEGGGGLLRLPSVRSSVPSSAGSAQGQGAGSGAALRVTLPAIAGGPVAGRQRR
jgi:hypothetical protein